MKKFIAVALTLMFVFSASYALATGCGGPKEPKCEIITNADVETGVYTDTMNNWNFSKNKNQEDYAQNYGWTGHAYDVEARGTKSAFAHGEGQSDLFGYGGAFQKEIKGGELSGSGALTIGTSSARGHAIGKDAPECNTGADNAKVEVEVFGYVAQANGAYSDDRDSFIGGGNTSDVEFSGQSDSSDRGDNDRYVKVQTGGQYKHWIKGKHGRGYWVYKEFKNGHPPHDQGWFFVRPIYGWVKVADLTAETRDSISGMGIAGGGTLVYAKQTSNSAVVAGVTAGFSTATLRGAENRSVVVSGSGAMGGVAQLPGNGYASFAGDYNYQGKNFGAGITGGYATMNTTNTGSHVSVSSSATSFSAAAVANPGDNDNRPD